MDLRGIIAYLITSVPKGSKSAKVTDFHLLKGHIADPATQKVYELQIKVYEAPNNGNIFVVDLSKIWKDRDYKEKSYHALYQRQVTEDKTTGEYDMLDDWKTAPLCNSWGNNDKEISFSEAEQAIHTRYEVRIRSLTYKGFKSGDIPVIWNGIFFIYDKDERKNAKYYGAGVDITDKMFFDLCTEFGLDIHGNIIKGTLMCDDF